MTRAWVVYESMFGNTREVAQAVADGLRGPADVELHEVGHAPPVPDDLGLLVVGGPTHAFGLSRPSTREDAARKSGHPTESRAVGLREWLDALPQPLGLPWFAAFDTKVNHPHLPGSAAHKAAKRLVRLGLRRAADPETFWVLGTEGPLAAGELDRARVWGRQLAATVPGPGASQFAG
jgi:hypothetical protein